MKSYERVAVGEPAEANAALFQVLRLTRPLMTDESRNAGLTSVRLNGVEVGLL